MVLGHLAADGRLWGVRAGPDGWRPVAAVRLAAAYDRFPSRSRPEEHRALLVGLRGVPVANPPSQIALCSDKLRIQGLLAPLGMPEVEADPARFAERLARWGTGFLKPRFGALGRGVRRVQPGDRLPARGPGAVVGIDEPMLLQRAVAPPPGWAGVAVRVLVQRDLDGRWRAAIPVARRHRTDPVVNHARGAQVAPLEDPGRVRRLAIRAAEILADQADGALLIEVGVDFAVDATGRPWLLEVNGRPRGRLEALATIDPAHARAHDAAVVRPLRVLAHRFG